jgi:hypothetical protein
VDRQQKEARMKTEWTEDDLRSTLQSVSKKAAADPKFKQLALTDPAAAIKEATGHVVPPGLTIDIVEGDKGGPGLQANVQHPPLELSDAELNQVAGGVIFRLDTSACPSKVRCGAISGKCPCGSGRSLKVG